MFSFWGASQKCKFIVVREGIYLYYSRFIGISRSCYEKLQDKLQIVKMRYIPILNFELIIFNWSKDK